MAQEFGIVKKPKPGVMAISAVLAIGGVGMILWWATQRGQQGYGALKPIAPGELMSLPISPSLESPGVITVRIGQVIPATAPSVMYVGPGRDTYTYFRVIQRIGGQDITVYGSGVAGVHVGPASEAAIFDLVSADQPQPSGCPQQALCAFSWPGPAPTPICGAPPVPGYGHALLEIYQRRDPQDADGFSSPTCGSADVPVPRVPVIVKRYPAKILFKV